MTRNQLASLIVADFAIEEQVDKIAKMSITETHDGHLMVFGVIVGSPADEAFLDSHRQRMEKVLMESKEDIMQDLINKLVDSSMSDAEMQVYVDFTRTTASKFVKQFMIENVMDMTTIIIGYIYRYARS